MKTIKLEVEINDEGLLGKMAAVEETRRAFNNALAELNDAITGQYGIHKPKARVTEAPSESSPDALD
ncbi:hypothetical protein LJC51_07520 [Lachnospiraceae bacterium OttesenSCG-928-J05]|nr:hypothetical protein [Lachnospiraceae bacterium OttesenSCG-928-J05]